MAIILELSTENELKRSNALLHSTFNKMWKLYYFI